jgi:beta-glucosidase
MQTGIHAPGIKLSGAQVNRAWHHAMISHGRAVKVIRERSKLASPKVGAAPCFGSFMPLTDSPADVEAARKALLSIKAKDMWQARWTLDPVFKGLYPEEGMKLWGEEAPVIRDEDRQYLGLDLDFLGVNIYNSTTVKAGKDAAFEDVPYSNDHPHTSINWPVTPDALYWTAKFLYEEYRKPIIITENGLSANDWISVDGKCHDPRRIDFLTRYLRGLERAIDEGINVMGYFQWSFIDNFEWAQGYYDRFGLTYVDFKTQKRTIKDSGHWYAKLIASNGSILKEGGNAPLS